MDLPVTDPLGPPWTKMIGPAQTGTRTAILMEALASAEVGSARDPTSVACIELRKEALWALRDHFEDAFAFLREQARPA